MLQVKVSGKTAQGQKPTSYLPRAGYVGWCCLGCGGRAKAKFFYDCINPTCKSQYAEWVEVE